MKPKLSNKKFYNKWDYKITLKLEGVGVFRYNFDEIILRLTDPKTRLTYTLEKAVANKDKILEILDFLLGYNPDSWQKRIEKDSIDFYTNDKSFYNDAYEKFKDLLVHRFEPDTSIGNLESFKIFSNKLPHDRYRYKVYLKPHKLAKNKEEKTKYIEWLTGQEGHISISKAVKEWFMFTDWNWDRRYIWVEDENTLLMLKLRNPEVCGRVYEYFLIDK
jgi:hypothetical protein